ncbi:thiamine pyrophosphate-binding protein [Gracilibacillus sp. YIM 98692]|uniref:thiamine pyrophosphate-binding protein n=1 Tax=Gracilibacillus sp. YIM 98692 TaxID=2663532 RepID=UPI0013D2419A|nr:thiamine pyrophosphate-binding protein [Gracilibacillus sp. YIM 98692]
MEKVATLLAKHFKKWGISDVFGIPGKAVVPLILEITDQDINFVTSKHECGAGYQAAGFALLSQKIGVAVGTSGPGGTNLITAAGQAKASHLPILIITGHPSIKDTGKALSQDATAFGTDIVEMFKPVTKFSARVERGDQVESYFQHALEKALTGSKGPVHLSIPADVLIEEVHPFEMDLPEPQHVISTRLEEVIELLNDAQKPVLFLGKGVHSSKAYEEVRQVAEYWDIPVMTTPGGKGSFISNHHLSLGAFGLGGRDEAHDYTEHGIDLMVVIGSKLSDMSLAGLQKNQYPEKVIHFDYDQTFIGKSINVPTLFISGDIKANLNIILENINRRENQSSNYISAKHEKSMNEIGIENGIYMSSKSAIEIMNEVLPEDTIIFGDDGSHTFYAIQSYDIKKPGTFFFDDVFGAMGHAIGYSIGAKLASPSKKIACLTGDGCLLMHGSEISTAVSSNSSVIFIVLNNSGLDMVDKGMKVNIGKSVGTTFDPPVDIYQYAQSMGATAFKARTSNQLSDALHTALVINETSVIEVIVDNNEIPPTMRRG